MFDAAWIHSCDWQSGEASACGDGLSPDSESDNRDIGQFSVFHWENGEDHTIWRETVEEITSERENADSLRQESRQTWASSLRLLMMRPVSGIISIILGITNFINNLDCTLLIGR
jgi:hypothetical protein